MPGSRIVFLGHYDDIPANFIKQYRMEYRGTLSSLTEELKFAQDFDYFILDSYLITQGYIDAYCHAPVKFIKIDDFSDFNLSKVDLVVNACLEAVGHPTSAKKSCLGLAFYPVREELREVRLANINQFKERIENTVIFMGAADQYDAGTKITKMLDKILKDTRISLITNKNTGHPCASINNNRIRYLPVSFEIEKYLKDADVVICGGGVTKFDCAYSCIANASLCQNPEQEKESRIWAEAGLTCYLGMAQSLETNEGQAMNELEKFCSVQARKAIVQCSRDKFFIDSTQNLVQVILEG